MWQGTATLRPGCLIYAGQFGAANRHHHAAAQLVLSVRGPIELRDGDGGQWRGQAALIPPAVPHEMVGAATGLLVFADAEGSLGQALGTRVRRTGLPIHSVAAWSAAARKLAAIGAAAELDPLHLAQKALDMLTDQADTTSSARHPALRQALDLMPVMLNSSIRLADLAAAVGISASRLGHLFTEELGLPFRPYVRWARLQRAIGHARHGGTATDAAHAAGFADSAHLTRVCREMFGLTPSHLARAVTLIQG